ncbi:hypothetical protein GCM10009795_039930 [Nocardioides hankookensis]|uniref:Uncharacterized protein n=1 Tax=Nocardioides hankookensis TaxID=443157 RepID=A0ABW1LQI8_9ACTN
MAWTAPRTWVAGEIVSASMLNTHLRDNLLALDFSSGFVAVTAAANVTSSSTILYRRSGMAVVIVEVTTTAAIGAGGTLFTLPFGYRPVALLFADLVNTATAAVVRVHADPTGPVTTQPALASGVQLRGSFVVPL